MLILRLRACKPALTLPSSWYGTIAGFLGAVRAPGSTMRWLSPALGHAARPKHDVPVAEAGPGSRRGTPACASQRTITRDQIYSRHAALHSLMAALAVLHAVQAQTQCIFTIAGSGVSGYTGDGGTATSAKLRNPHGVALDGSGGFLIAERLSSVIRRVTSAGIISTVAGTGALGYSGDGAAATSAKLTCPQGVALDGSGGFLIADNNNHVIRRVTSTGIISTAAGTGGVRGFSGDGAAATGAMLAYPESVALDGSGGFLITDQYNHVIRRVTSSGIISTAAGTGALGYSGDGAAATSAKLSFPSSVALDGSGGFLIADRDNHVIRRVTSTGIISTVAGAGNFNSGYSGDGAAATSAKLNRPTGVALDGSGGFLIADNNNHVIRRVTSTGIISTVAGTGALGYSGDGAAATSAKLNSPHGVALDGSGGFLIAEKENHVIRYVTPPNMCTSSLVRCTVVDGSVSIAQCLFASVAPLFSIFALMTDQACTMNQPNAANVAAYTRMIACPIPSSSPANVQWVMQGTSGFSASTTITAPVTAAVVALSSDTSSGWRSVWGAQVSIQVNYSSISSVGLESAVLRTLDAQLPCLNASMQTSLNVNTANLTCTLLLWSEALYKQPFGVDVRVKVPGPDTRFTLRADSVAIDTGIIFSRPQLRSVITPLVSPSGGSNITLVLPRSVPSSATPEMVDLQLPADSVCDGMRSSLRAWVGAAPMLGCVWHQGTVITCQAPAGSAALARVTVELCGLFNLTSDGLDPGAGPLGVPSASAPEAAFYVSYDPSAALQQLYVVVDAVRTPQNVSIVMPLMPIEATQLITSIHIDGILCTIVSSSAGSVLCTWSMPRPPNAYAPDARGNVNMSISIRVRNQTLMQPPQGVTVALRPRVRGSVATFTCLSIQGDWLAGDDSNSVTIYLGNTSVVCAAPLVATSADGSGRAYCVMPSTIASDTPGYPVLPINVINNRGVSFSNSSLMLPPAASVRFLDDSPTLRTALPTALTSSSINRGAFNVSPALAFSLTGAFPISCVASVTESRCPAGITTDTYAWGTPVLAASATQATPQLVAGMTFGASDASAAGSAVAIVSPTFAIASQLGCSLQVSVQCTDARGQGMSLATPGVRVTAAYLTARWATTSPSDAVALPGQALAPQRVIINTTANTSSTSLSPLVRCSSALFPATRVPSANTLTSLALPLAAVTCSVAALDGSGAAALAAMCTGLELPTSTLLNSTLVIMTQCVYLPSQEVMTLPLSNVYVPAAAISLSRSSPAGVTPPVDAYASIRLNASVTLQGINSTSMPLATARGTCQLVMESASSASVSLSSESGRSYSVQADGALAPALAVVLQAPPLAYADLRMECSLWNSRVVSSTLRINTAPFTVRWSDALVSSVPLSALPSSATSSDAGSLFALPSLSIATTARSSVTCTISVASSSCPSPAFTSYGVGFVPASTAVSARIAGLSSVSINVADNVTSVDVSFTELGLSALSGCSLQLACACRDAASRQNTTAFSVSAGIPRLAAAWSASSLAVAAAPIALAELPTLVLSLSTRGVALASSAWSCTAFLSSSADVVFSVNSTLLSQQTRGVSVATVVIAGDAGGATLAGMDASTLTPGSAPVIHAECVWLPTTERVRLPPLQLATVSASLQWLTSGSSLTVRRGSVASISLQISSAAPVTAATCTWNSDSGDAATRGASNTAVFNASAAAFVLVPASGGGSGSMLINASMALTGSPGSSLSAWVTCQIWKSTTISSPRLTLTLAPLELRVVSSPALVVIPSTASSPWLTSPALIVQMREAEMPLPASCTLTPTAGQLGLSLLVDNSQDVLQLSTGVASDPVSQSVSMPPFGVATAYSSDGSPASVSVRLTCSRQSTGDTAPPLTLTFTLLQMRTSLCTNALPANITVSQQVLPPFSVSVNVATTLLGTPDRALCVSGNSDSTGASRTLSTVTLPVGITSLPPVTCTVTDARNDTSASLILQGNSVTTSTTLATLRALSLTAQPDTLYPLRLQCFALGVPIPPAIPMPVRITGCPPGTEGTTLLCQPCGGGNFSLGSAARELSPLLATCRGCPPAGATCGGGIITLLPNYYRPQRQVAARWPLGPDSELYPCANAEACVVHGTTSTTTHSCAPGYTGALCGVCDADYGFFGQVCRPCWNRAGSQAFVSFGLIAILALLIYVALRKTESGKAPAAIALKILLSYIQAVGSLRAFKAGGTAAYNAIFGWTDAVSASPLGAGVIQCLWSMSFLLQYILTITLPLLAAFAVMSIFFIATLFRHLHVCGHRTAASSISNRHLTLGVLDTEGLVGALRTWQRERRHIATLLFVLFLAYMAIISSSLRTLDCVQPIDGISYLRVDLRVVCYEGQHAVAALIAYSVLGVVGIGFPALLCVQLLRASSSQLEDPSFQAAWGFLYDGYRMQPEGGGRSGSGAIDPGDTVRNTVINPLQSWTEPTLQRSPLRTGRRSTLGSVVQLEAVPRHGGIEKRAASEETHAPGHDSDTSLQLKAMNSMNARLQVCCPRSVQYAFTQRLLWWEALILTRKALIVLTSVLVTDPYNQCAVGAIVQLVALVLQVNFQPYTSPIFNLLETLALLTGALTAIISGTLIKFGATNAELAGTTSSTTIATSSAAEWAITIVLAFINLSTLIIIGGTWLYLLRPSTQAKVVSAVRRASTVSSRQLLPRSSSARVQLTSATLAEGDEAASTRTSLSVAQIPAVLDNEAVDNLKRNNRLSGAVAAAFKPRVRMQSVLPVRDGNGEQRLEARRVIQRSEAADASDEGSRQKMGPLAVRRAVSCS